MQGKCRVYHTGLPASSCFLCCPVQTSGKGGEEGALFKEVAHINLSHLETQGLRNSGSLCSHRRRRNRSRDRIDLPGNHRDRRDEEHCADEQLSQRVTEVTSSSSPFHDPFQSLHPHPPIPIFHRQPPPPPRGIDQNYTEDYF